MVSAAAAMDAVVDLVAAGGSLVAVAFRLTAADDPEVGPLLMPAVAPRLSRTPGGVRWPGPRLGQHTDEVLAEAGLDDDAPFPERELGTPRGRQGAPRKKVALPEGWLDDTDGRGAHLREDVDETTGG